MKEDRYVGGLNREHGHKIVNSVIIHFQEGTVMVIITGYGAEESWKFSDTREGGKAGYMAEEWFTSARISEQKGEEDLACQIQNNFTVEAGSIICFRIFHSVRDVRWLPAGWPGIDMP